MSDQKYLPVVVQRIVPRLNQAASIGDQETMSDIIRWGYQAIEQEYDPHPLTRPTHYVKKWNAEREWRQAIHDTGVQLRRIMTQKQVEAFQYALDQRIEERKFQDAERRRQQSLGFDSSLRVGEYQATRSFDTDEEIRKARALAGIGQEFGLNAANKPAEDPNESILKLNREMARVYADPTLSMEQKHIQTRSLQTSINRIIDQQGRQAERR